MAKTKQSVEVVAKATATAIQASNGGRITTEAHKAMIAEIATASEPDAMAENISAIANLSALNQQLERAGLVKASRTLTAFELAVQKALES